jgi:hypothetical protein
VTDFPAAHSMDTTWFAIDADGCVGIFDSNQGGAVPEDLSVVANDIELQECLLEILANNNGSLLDRGLIDFDSILQSMSLENLSNRIRSNDDYAEKHNYQMSDLNGLFLMLSTAEVIPELEKQLDKRFGDVMFELSRDDNCILIYTSRCKVSWLKSAIESGLVLSGSKLIYLHENLNLLGWYVYDCDSNYPIPYKSNQPPKKPIYFQDLPPEIGQNLRLNRFPNLRFSNTNNIQPLEHMPCSTWWYEDGKWQGIDGEWHELFPEDTDV